MRALLPLLLFATTPAIGAATPWQEVAPGVKLRLIADATVSADGTTKAALEIDMPVGTKTYWRVPGESGIPTEMDFSGSTGASTATVLWPYPVIDQQAGLTDFAYYGPTVLPVSLTAAGMGSVLRASVTMGICDEICVPVSAAFELPVDYARPDLSESLRIGEAVSRAPLEWSVATAVGRVGYDADSRALTIEGIDARVALESFIADFGPSGQLFGAPQKSRDERAVSLPLLGGRGEDIRGRDVTLTFMTAAGPYWTSVRIASDGSTVTDH